MKLQLDTQCYEHKKTILKKTQKTNLSFDYDAFHNFVSTEQLILSG